MSRARARAGARDSDPCKTQEKIWRSKDIFLFSLKRSFHRVQRKNFIESSPMLLGFRSTAEASSQEATIELRLTVIFEVPRGRWPPDGSNMLGGAAPWTTRVPGVCQAL